MTNVLIFGSFDILHPGHMFFIKEAQKYGQVFVCLALDGTIKKLKARAPLNPLLVRKKNLEALGFTVVPGDSRDRLKVFRELSPQIVMLGYDQRTFVRELKDHIHADTVPTRIMEAPPFHPELFKSTKIRSVLEDPASAFLLIDKPPGEPSFRTVTALRNLTGIRQIGFAGTLDPIASGLLVCGLGRATKLLDWWHLFPKTYETTAQLGMVSDTYDATGAVEQVSDELPTQAEIENALLQFHGTIEQEPPMYSAKKRGGKKLYELAREGRSVARKKADITIHSIELLSYTYPYFQVRVTCSSGTYIRSLVHDLGQKLGMGALVSQLRRTAIGSYTAVSAVAIPQLTAGTWRQHTQPLDHFRASLNRYFLDEGVA